MKGYVSPDFAWIATLVEQHKQVSHTLSQFRRQPKWKLCFAMVTARHSHMFEMMPDGCMAMDEATAKQMIEYADQEFIEHLIRCEAEMEGKHEQATDTESAAQGAPGKG